MKWEYKAVMLFLTLLIFCVGSVCAAEPDNSTIDNNSSVDAADTMATVDNSQNLDITNNRNNVSLQHIKTTKINENVTVDTYRFIAGLPCQPFSYDENVTVDTYRLNGFMDTGKNTSVTFFKVRPLDGSNVFMCYNKTSNYDENLYDKEFINLMKGKDAIDKTNRDELVKEYVKAKAISMFLSDETYLNEYMGDGIMIIASPITRTILNLGYTTCLMAIHEAAQPRKKHLSKLDMLTKKRENLMQKKNELYSNIKNRLNTYNINNLYEGFLHDHKYNTIINDKYVANNEMKKIKNSIRREHDISGHNLMMECNKHQDYSRYNLIRTNTAKVLKEDNDNDYSFEVEVNGELVNKDQLDRNDGEELYTELDKELVKTSDEIGELEEEVYGVSGCTDIQKQAEQESLDALNGATAFCTVVYLTGQVIVGIFEFTQGFLNRFNQGDATTSDLEKYANYRRTVCTQVI